MGLISYTMGAAATAVKAVIGTPTMSPATPVAGKSFSLVIPVNRSDTGALGRDTSGTSTCETTIDGVAVPCRDRFAKGVARLQITAPSGTQGKTLKVHVTIKLTRQTLDRTISFRIA